MPFPEPGPQVLRQSADNAQRIVFPKLTRITGRGGRRASQNTRAIRQHDLTLLAPSGAAEGAARAMEANAPGESELSGRNSGGGKTPVRLFKCGQTASQFRSVNRSGRCNRIFDMIYSRRG